MNNPKILSILCFFTIPSAVKLNSKSIKPKFLSYCNGAGRMTPNVVYKPICRFVVSPTCVAAPGAKTVTTLRNP